MQPKNTLRQLTAELFTPRNGDCWTMSWQKSPTLHQAQHLPRLRRRHRRPRLDQRLRHRRWQHLDLNYSPQGKYQRSRILIPPPFPCSGHRADKPAKASRRKSFSSSARRGSRSRSTGFESLPFSAARAQWGGTRSYSASSKSDAAAPLKLKVNKVRGGYAA